MTVLELIENYCKKNKIEAIFNPDCCCIKGDFLVCLQNGNSFYDDCKFTKKKPIYNTDDGCYYFE